MGKILFPMRFIIVLLFLTLNAEAQEIIIFWDVINTLENKKVDSNFVMDVPDLLPETRTISRYYLNDEKLAIVSIYDPLNHIRTVFPRGENHAHEFITLDGKKYYKRRYYKELEPYINNVQINNEEISKPKFIEKIDVGPFRCKIDEMQITERKISIKTTAATDIWFENKLLNYLHLPGLENIGFIINLEADLVFYRKKMISTNFKTGKVDPSIFSIHKDGYSEIDSSGKMKLIKLMMRSNYSSLMEDMENETTNTEILEILEIENNNTRLEIENNEMNEREIAIGDGVNHDIYLRMCQDKAIRYCSQKEIKQKPSFDKSILIRYLETSDAKHKSLSQKELDRLLIKYDLVSQYELNSFKKIINKFDKDLDGINYCNAIQFLYHKKMLDNKECRKNLIQNLAKNNYFPKNKNHPEAIDFINRKNDWKTFLSSYKGIYNLKYKNKVESKTAFLREIKSIINTIFSDFSVTVNERTDEIELKKKDLIISYPVKTEHLIIATKFSDERKIINLKNLKYDFEAYSKNGLLDLLRQISADFNLGMIFEFINSNSILLQYNVKLDEVNLFKGSLFLCIDKNDSNKSFGKVIPFTRTDYNDQRDNLAGINGFYYINHPGPTYVPLYQKEKLLNILNEKRLSNEIDSSFDASHWFSKVKNQQYDNLELMIQSIPNLGVILSTSLFYGLSYDKKGGKYEDIFPKLHQLFGSDFQPLDVVLTCGELNAELTFKFFEKTYTIKSDIFKIEEALLKKAIDLLKENNLYKTRKVYQSIEDFTDVNTKKLFYLTKETHQILSEEFELPLVEFPY